MNLCVTRKCCSYSVKSIGVDAIKMSSWSIKTQCIVQNVHTHTYEYVYKM